MIDARTGKPVETVEITCVVHAESARAILISEMGEESLPVWVARSQILETVESGRTSRIARRNGQMGVGRIVTITIPAWLARQQGLV